jgi:hypothetical protein
MNATIRGGDAGAGAPSAAGWSPDGARDVNAHELAAGTSWPRPWISVPDHT